MSTLALPSSTDTSPHFDIKATDDGHPHDVLLVLELSAVQDDRTMTVWAKRRKRHTDLLIDPAGNRSRSPLRVGSSRLLSSLLSSPLENGAAFRLLARSAFSSCFRSRSFSSSARSN
jgi:hypothetical protein